MVNFVVCSLSSLLLPFSPLKEGEKKKLAHSPGNCSSPSFLVGSKSFSYKNIYSVDNAFQKCQKDIVYFCRDVLWRSALKAEL